MEILFSGAGSSFPVLSESCEGPEALDGTRGHQGGCTENCTCTILRAGSEQRALEHTVGCVCVKLEALGNTGGKLWPASEWGLLDSLQS